MTPLPTKVLSQQVRELLDGRRVLAGVFTTFTLEPEFFEQEVVSLLAGDSLIQNSRARLYQLEQELRGAIGPLTVYYDRQGIRPDAGKKLDIRYVPVHVPTGLFHPKVILLLTGPQDEHSDQATTLVCGVLSANLTKCGWWQSLEGAHFEVAREGERCSFARDLRKFLDEVRQLGQGKSGDNESLDRIRTWLAKSVEPFEHGTIAGRLRTRLIAGRGAVIPALAEIRGEQLDSASLEVISPFFDEGKTSALTEIAETLGLREVTVFLPTKLDGTANVTVQQYDAIRSVPSCGWGKLPQDILKLGKNANTVSRGVHAKVYRFIRKSAKYEAILVGSHNLTGPALQRGGNLEASFFVEREDPGPIDRWLTSDEKRPKHFVVKVDEGDDAAEPFVPLQLSYDWEKERAEAIWGGRDESPLLRVESASSTLFELRDLPSNEWITLDQAVAEELARILKSTSLLQVRTPQGGRASILVQEYGMSRKPSLAMNFTVADVLEFWARLTPEQKAAFLEDRAGSTVEGEPDFLVHGGRLEHLKGFFDTFAGIFHGFEMLRKQVLESVAAERPKQADYLLFGKRYDSLPCLLDRILDTETEHDPLQGYLLLLSARQLLKELRRREEPFFQERRKEIASLIDRTEGADALSAKLDLGPDGARYLEWFESHFLKNARTEVVSDG